MFAAKNELLTRPSGGYRVTNSLRFRGGQYLNRTPASAGNRTVWTWSCWVKRAKLGARQELLCADVNGTNDASAIYFDTSDRLNVQNFVGSVLKTQKITNAVFRDPSAWYHIVVSQNGSTACTVYVNGVSQTFSTSTGPDATNWYINSTTPQSIGNDSQLLANYLDGYLAEVNFIDGQALTPSSFGAYDTNGVWQPAACTVSDYGKNGFYLPFSDSANIFNDKAAIATNHSAANNWTANSLQTTSSTLTTYDYMIDSPTNYADGGNGRGNYAVLNPIDKDASATISNGNLNIISSAAVGNSTYRASRSSLAVSSGLWYAEFTLTLVSTNAFSVGISPTTDVINGANYYFGSTSGSYGIYYNGANQYKGNNATGTQLAAGSPANGDIFQIAVDLTNGKIWFGKNNTWYEGNPATATTPSFTFTPSASYSFGGSVNITTTASNQLDANFGQRPFSYTPPSNFLALNTQNLPTPTIANGAQYMAAVTYTGNAGTNPVTTTSANSGNNPLGTTFQPDLVWTKSRNQVSNHLLYDVVRGPGYYIQSSTSNAEAYLASTLTSFNSDGFTVGAGDNGNASGSTAIAWQWLGGGAPTVNNTAGAGNVPTAGSVLINGANSTSALAGSIAATRLSANQSAGFSVVTFTAPNSASPQTFGHGLGVAPSMIFIKIRNTTGSWQVYHASIGNTQRLLLNTTDAATTTSGPWNNTSPSSTVVTIGTTFVPDASASTYVAYCFAPVAGYSAFGSYTGNGSTDGPFVFTGFRPRWILIKRYDSGAEAWYLYDTTRDTYNVAQNTVSPQGSGAEGSGAIRYFDILSNGLKCRTSDGAFNGSGGTYIYAAFAENPFKYSRAR